uniref:Uncharacterized protein n=1 Tax=Romanomermis culicivorax TaxID=13658 RepID=A0A915KKG8_ROMCU
MRGGKKRNADVIINYCCYFSFLRPVGIGTWSRVWPEEVRSSFGLRTMKVKYEESVQAKIKGAEATGEAAKTNFIATGADKRR